MKKRKKIKPVNLFYSYSHKDKTYRQKLEEALSPLYRRNLIQEWHDGKILAGEEWERSIYENLKLADIILLLISSSFVKSDFCHSKEMKIALKRHRNNEAIVIPIILRDVHMKGLKFAKLQALPEGAKPINRWRPRDKAWKNICEEIERKINYLSGPRPVNDVLSGVKGAISSVDSAVESSMAAGKRRAKRFRSVSEFWEARANILGEIGYATIPGTFSQFAPMMFGSPKAKRRLHKEFRRSIQRSKRFSEMKRATINACMSVSAGQMVWKSRKSGDRRICFGLYNSIVRNSIPVFVTKKYYNNNLKHIFSQKKRKTFEAMVRGKIITFDNTYIRDFFRKHRLNKYIPSFIVDDLCKNVYGLEVDGVNSNIAYKSPSRYLDGDIWIALETGGREIFLTSFLDVANPLEREEEFHHIMRDLEEISGSPRVIAQYDEIGEVVRKGPRVKTEKEFIERICKFGF